MFGAAKIPPLAGEGFKDSLRFSHPNPFGNTYG
jgi:hypothetical protein